MNGGQWHVGDRVRFVGDYVLPASPESVPHPEAKAGATGVVVKVKSDCIWVRVAGGAESVTLWFPDAFPDTFAKTTLVERMKP
jgi:ribosomal protein L21E